VDFSRATLEDVDLKHAAFDEPIFTQCQMTSVEFFKAKLPSIGFQSTVLKNVTFSHCILEKADFSGSEIRGCRIEHCDLRGLLLRPWDGKAVKIKDGAVRQCDLTGATIDNATVHHVDLSHSKLHGADLQGATLDGCECANTKFSGADLRGLEVARCNLTGSEWEAARVGRRSRIFRCHFNGPHNVDQDYTDTIKYVGLAWLHWSRLRLIGTLPFFGVSTTALAASLIVINGVGYINESEVLHRDVVSYPIEIPIPLHMVWLLISSLLVFIGATVFQIACPQRIQHFSETEWVDAQRHPRLLYIADALRRNTWAIFSLVCTVIGGTIGLLLLGERIWRGFGYLVAQTVGL
jgi:uncharacterized protein YjbI with pentapeptide repeats